MLTISEIYQSHYKRLLSVASRVGVPWSSCEDVLQETVTAVWLKGYQRVTANLLYVAVRRASINWVKSAGRTPQTCELWEDDHQEESGNAGSDPLDRVTDTKDREMVDKYLAGYTEAEIGREQGVTQQCISRRWRAMRDKYGADSCIIQQ